MGIWNGASIGNQYSSYAQIADKVKSLTLPGFYPQWIVKAGEGGAYQTQFDPSPLAIKSAGHLAQVKGIMAGYGVDVQPYLNVRGTWMNVELEQFKAVYDAVGFVIVHLEPGQYYYDPNVNQAQYVAELWNRIPGEGMELVSIPRTNSYLDLKLWSGVGHYAAWETYGDVAADLEPNVALPRVDYGKGPAYQIPIVQRSMLNRMGDWQHWIKGYGFQVWYIDGDW